MHNDGSGEKNALLASANWANANPACRLTAVTAPQHKTFAPKPSKKLRKRHPGKRRKARNPKPPKTVQEARAAEPEATSGRFGPQGDLSCQVIMIEIWAFV